VAHAAGGDHQDTLNELIQYLDHDDVVIDGGNSFTATT